MKHLRNALIARSRSLVATIALGAAALTVGGCSTASLYFHNQGYEDATTEVKKQVDALDVAGAFEKLNANAAELAKQEDAAVIRSTVALRNERLSQLIDPIPGDGSILQGETATASRRMRAFISSDLKVLVSEPANEAAYRAGAEALRAREKAVDGNSQQVAFDRIRAKLAELKYEGEVRLDCATARAVVAGTDPEEILQGAVQEYDTLVLACAAREERLKFLEAYQEIGGAIGEAARNYVTALSERQAKELEAAKLQGEIDATLKKMRTRNPDAFKEDLKKQIKNLEKASAFAEFAGLTEVENFLKCGLIVDLESATEGLAEDEAVKAKPVDTATAATQLRADDATPASESEMQAAKSAVCPTEAKPAEAEGGSAETTPEEADRQAKWNAAVSTIIAVVSDVTEAGLATDRLKRIDTNIVALSDLRQRLGLAKAAVAYNNALLPLYKGYLYAMFDQYRLLSEAADANQKLLRLPDPGFRTMRNTAHKRDAALALSSYTGAWNYGKIAAVAIDFRFKQALRTYELQVAASSAANYKATVQPITDGLAQYGKGGITPDTVALIITNLGVLAGVVTK
jgi:hypothetical protein